MFSLFICIAYDCRLRKRKRKREKPGPDEESIYGDTDSTDDNLRSNQAPSVPPSISVDQTDSDVPVPITDDSVDLYGYEATYDNLPDNSELECGQQQPPVPFQCIEMLPRSEPCQLSRNSVQADEETKNVNRVIFIRLSFLFLNVE